MHSSNVIDYLNYENIFSNVQIISRNFLSLVVNRMHSFGAAAFKVVGINLTACDYYGIFWCDY